MVRKEDEPQGQEQKNQIETARLSVALIEGLRFLGNLTVLDLSFVEKEIQPQLNNLFELAKERMKLGGRDSFLPGQIKDFFLNQPEVSNWVTDTDAKHTVASFGYLAEICTVENFTLQEQKIVLSAMVAHDCAYPKTSQTGDPLAFRSSDARLTHMKDGTEEFRNFVRLINHQSPNFYNDEEIELACSIIEQHDNPSVKKDGQRLQFSYDPPPAKLLWAHREADRLWMLDRGGFALDLIRRVLETNPSYNPSGYLKYVISRHIQEANVYQDNESCHEYQAQKSLYRTRTGFEIFQRLIREREREYGVNS